jgi:hypothetical protein
MIGISPAELAFLREAVDEKHASLMKALVFEKKDLFFGPSVTEAIKPLNEWTATMKAENSGSVTVKPARKTRKVAAPYGLKKDGTPKKKPGRQTGEW